MIERVAEVLEGSGHPGLAELRSTLDELLGETKFLGEERLKPRVYRLRFAGPRGASSVVVKRLDAGEAVRSEFAARRWLPAVGLPMNGPGLLGVAAARAGRWVWHVYEDLGDASLDKPEFDTARVATAVQLVAQLHSRFARHPMLAECRQHGGHLDISYFSSNVRDAIHSLRAMRPPQGMLAPEGAAVRDRLVMRLTRLQEDEPRRARALLAYGGPETLLHGDLWTSNTFVLETQDGCRARLIDWDHAGVGPASYDLSTLLLRFPPARRGWILDRYAESVEGGVWRLPARPELNLVFETAELARYANRVVWPALAMTREGAPWSIPELTRVESWFEALEPVVPEAGPAHVAANPGGGNVS